MNMNDLARDPRQIGNLVRRARKAQGLSQETISLIETGHPTAKLETMLSVLAALNLEFRIVPRSKARAADIEEIF